MISALTLLVELYKDDVRKSSGAPGIHHPLGVCDLVMGAGGDEDTSIGALFHDMAEDKGGEVILSRIRAEYGERVERIVRDCSDTIPSDYSLKEPWIQRKVIHIHHIATMDDDSRVVLAADTLHNTRDHIRGFRVNGLDWFKNFRANVYLDRALTPGICAASTLWYLVSKSNELLKYSVNSTIAKELYLTVQSFRLEIPSYISIDMLSNATSTVSEKHEAKLHAWDSQ